MKSYTVYEQDSAYESPHSLGARLKLAFWQFCWAIFCSWTPKPANRWRLIVLKLFGARLHGYVFVHQRAKIHAPWNLTMYDRACIGDAAVIYTLGEVVLKSGCTVAQEVYLCTGSHDFSRKALPLITARIEIGEDAFVGVRALILPGVTIGDRAVVGGGSVVTKSVESDMIVGGNPAKPIRPRGPIGV